MAIFEGCATRARPKDRHFYLALAIATFLRAVRWSRSLYELDMTCKKAFLWSAGVLWLKMAGEGHILTHPSEEAREGSDERLRRME